MPLRRGEFRRRSAREGAHAHGSGLTQDEWTLPVAGGSERGSCWHDTDVSEVASAPLAELPGSHNRRDCGRGGSSLCL